MQTDLNHFYRLYGYIGVKNFSDRFFESECKGMEEKPNSQNIFLESVDIASFYTQTIISKTSSLFQGGAKINSIF